MKRQMKCNRCGKPEDTMHLCDEWSCKHLFIPKGCSKLVIRLLRRDTEDEVDIEDEHDEWRILNES